MTALVGSETVPVMVPRSLCANAMEPAKNNMDSKPTRRFIRPPSSRQSCVDKSVFRASKIRSSPAEFKYNVPIDVRAALYENRKPVLELSDSPEQQTY